VNLIRAPYVPVPTGTHEKSPALADKLTNRAREHPPRPHHVTVHFFARRYSINVEALRQISGMADRERTAGWVDADRVGHPVDLPKGYHAVPRGQAWRTRPVTDSGCCPRGTAWSGCARSTGYPTMTSAQDHQVTAGQHDRSPDRRTGWMLGRV
jgi:hypothetical protein